jgi:hypothetical protein
LAAIDHDSAWQPQSTVPVELSRRIRELKDVLDTLTRERDWARSRAVTHAATISSNFTSYGHLLNEANQAKTVID